MLNQPKKSEIVGREFARENLDGVVAGLLKRFPFSMDEFNLLDAAAIPWEVSLRTSLEFHDAWKEKDTTSNERDDVAVRVHGHRERLEAFLSAKGFDRHARERKTEVFRELAYYIALVVVPCFARLDRFDQAVDMVRLFFGLSRAKSLRDVSNAGGRGESLEHHHLMLTLALWALTLHYPKRR